MKFDDMLYGMTTIIESYINSYKSQGSGFFYNALEEKETLKDDQWRKIEGIWLVTNRHVALPKINDNEMIPDTFLFNLRQIVDGRVQWLPIILSKDEYKRRLKVHNNDFVDVAVIEVGDLIIEKMKEGIPLMSFAGLTSEHLPKNSRLDVNVGNEILVAGYPRGFYDIENKFPIVKSGIVSSKWGCDFNGKPMFLIDSKLFPGSSGSVVLTNPQYVAVINEKLMYNKDGSYILLGVYSGEPISQNIPIEFEDMTIIKKDLYNVGYVWYSDLIPEIILNGIKVNS